MPVQLFPNWVVKLVRQPNLATKFWLNNCYVYFNSTSSIIFVII